MELYYLIAVSVVSVITFIVYLVDKIKAKIGGFRVPEAVLLTLSVLGGATGGLLAMGFCRHKTKHWYFFLVNLASLFLHAGIYLLLIIK
ncbi:MAG: DUF1294 domain-containing protein [Clostridia bacterium]|nr:DUF1294 domain-containing protein [Clostridia bacterium]